VYLLFVRVTFFLAVDSSVDGGTGYRGKKPRHTHRKSTANPVCTFIDDVSKDAINMTRYNYLGTLSLSPGVVYCPSTGSLTVYFSHIYSVQVAMYVEKIC